jgi:RNA polymerase II elongation factor ELL
LSNTDEQVKTDEYFQIEEETTKINPQYVEEPTIEPLATIREGIDDKEFPSTNMKEDQSTQMVLDSEKREKTIVTDVCENMNNINETTVYRPDTVADSGFMDSNDNANPLEHHESTQDNNQAPQPGSIMPHENRDYSPLPSSPRQFIGSDFRKEFIKIRDRDTRKRYKVEFGRNYDRYRELHCKIEKVSKRFATLESQLRREPEGSESFKRMAAKVQKEYQATKGRKEFIAMRQEFEYLHEKMAHIKLLVQEFDKSRVATN